MIKINFKKWWKNYYKREEEKKEALISFLNENIQKNYNEGRINFAILLNEDRMDIDYAIKYLEELGFKVTISHRKVTKSICYLKVEVPKE